MIFTSPHPDIELSEESFPSYVLARTRELGNKPALVCAATGQTISYSALHDGVRRVAVELAHRSFRKGDVLAILSPNCPEYAVAFHAVATLGGVNTTLNPLWTADEIAGQLRDSGARYLLTVPFLLEKARAAAGDTGVEEIFVFGEAPGVTPFASLLEEEGELPRVKIDAREDVVALPYSSGTTGMPKGVMLTHFNLVSNLAQMEAIYPLSEDDVAIAVLPFFHIYGMVVVMNLMLRKGATVVSLPRFELREFLSTIERYRVTRAHVVPPIVAELAKDPIVDDFDLSSLRLVGSGAAPLGAETARACSERIGTPVLQGYGLTETSPVTHWMAPDDPGAHRLGSVGPNVPNTRVRIVDLENGEFLGTGQGADQVQGIPGRPSRARGPAPLPSRRGRRRGGPQSRRGGRRGTEGLPGQDRVPGGKATHRSGRTGIRGGAGGTLQAGPQDRVRGRHPEIFLREDPPPTTGGGRVTLECVAATCQLPVLPNPPTRSVVTPTALSRQGRTSWRLRTTCAIRSPCSTRWGPPEAFCTNTNHSSG